MTQEINATIELQCDEQNPLFDKTHLQYKCFESDYNKVRYYTLLLLQSAPSQITERDLLEQQISEMIKNAIKHGNNCDIHKNIHVWFSFSPIHAHLIIEDEGEGFQEMERWNDFNKNRLESIENKNFERLEHYVSFKTQRSDKFDGGNALFAALEYWNEGLILNNKRNALAMYRTFPTNQYSFQSEEDY